MTPLEKFFFDLLNNLCGGINGFIAHGYHGYISITNHNYQISDLSSKQLSQRFGSEVENQWRNSSMEKLFEDPTLLENPV